MKTSCRCEIKRMDGMCCAKCSLRRTCHDACLVSRGELPKSECRGGDIYGEVE